MALAPTPTPVSAATQAPPLLSEHGAGQATLPKKTVQVKAHTRSVTVKTKAPPTVDPVTAQVNAAQLPQLQAIQAAEAASTLAAKNASTTTAGYYSALGDLLKGVAPETQSIYQSAAGDTSAFGKGFSDGLAHVQSQNQGDATNLANISGGAAPAPVNPAAANALYSTGGYIPASTMEREGAGFASAAAGLPGAAVGQGAGALAKIAADNQTAQQGFGTKLTDLAAQVPGLRLQYQTYDDKVALAAKTAAQHAHDVKVQQQLQYIAATGVDPTTGKLTPKAQAEWARVSGYMPDGTPTAATRNANVRTQIAKTNAQNAAARLTLDQQKALSDMYGVDANGNLTIPGRKAALAEWKAQHPPAKGGFTANQKAKLQNTAGNLANLYYYGKPNKIAGVDQPGTGVAAITDYQHALTLMMSHGIPLSMAQVALNALYPAGQENRPYVEAQARNALERAGHAMGNPQAPPTKYQADWLNAHGFHYSGPLANDPNPATNPNAAGPPAPKGK